MDLIDKLTWFLIISLELIIIIQSIIDAHLVLLVIFIIILSITIAILIKIGE